MVQVGRNHLVQPFCSRRTTRSKLPRPAWMRLQETGSGEWHPSPGQWGWKGIIFKVLSNPKIFHNSITVSRHLLKNFKKGDSRTSLNSWFGHPHINLCFAILTQICVWPFSYKFVFGHPHGEFVFPDVPGFQVLPTASCPGAPLEGAWLCHLCTIPPVIYNLLQAEQPQLSLEAASSSSKGKLSAPLQAGPAGSLGFGLINHNFEMRGKKKPPVMRLKSSCSNKASCLNITGRKEERKDR